MATFRAITAVCESVLYLLRTNATQELFNNELEFRVYQSRDFTQPMASGVSLFLYRIYHNGTRRTPAGRMGPDGRRQRTVLPVDLHFLLTVWGRDASLQHAVTGWMMRTLEDNPTFTADLMNSLVPNSFRRDEAVEVVFADLGNLELIELWRTLVQNMYQLSVPYVARVIEIESLYDTGAGEPVQERTFDLAVPREPVS